jgi:hypothetical protein
MFANEILHAILVAVQNFPRVPTGPYFLQGGKARFRGEGEESGALGGEVGPVTPNYRKCECYVVDFVKNPGRASGSCHF